MQARYPKHIVLLVEGLVGPLSSNEAKPWMSRRVRPLMEQGLVDHAVVYEKARSSGTLAKPRFLSVFETSDPDTTLTRLTRPYGHDALRPLGHGSYVLLDGLPRAAGHESDGGLMVGLTECTDPADESDFNAWYDAVHAADVIRSPWFWNTQRYRKTDGNLPTYAALYETGLPGSEALKHYMQWPERATEMHPRIANIHVWSFDFLAAL